MSSETGRTCAVCGDVAPSISEHAVHATLAHPELNRTNRAQRLTRGEGSVAQRPVSCWRCARELRPENGVVPRCECGWEHPGFAPDRGEPLYQQEYPSREEQIEDRHSRPGR
jgi:hypothetical protein